MYNKLTMEPTYIYKTEILTGFLYNFEVWTSTKSWIESYRFQKESPL